jgi:hypothetical protein
MIGSKELIEMRMRGIKPPSVTLVDAKVKVDWFEYNAPPVVCIHGAKMPDMDLRFVVDMIVFIEMGDKNRSDQLFQKCIDSGARIVSGGVFTKNPSPNARKADSEQRYYNRDAP